MEGEHKKVERRGVHRRIEEKRGDEGRADLWRLCSQRRGVTREASVVD